MVDEDQYRRTYRDLIPQPCPFEKAILSRTCRCSRSERANIAEREAVNCADASARGRCLEFLALLRDKANFALGLVRTPGELPHAASIKIQCGGLAGLQKCVLGEGEVSDIYALIDQVRVEYGSLDQLPFTEIVQAVSRFEGRKRRKRK